MLLFGGQRQSMITWPEPERTLAALPVGIPTHLAWILALPARHLAWEEGRRSNEEPLLKPCSVIRSPWSNEDECRQKRKRCNVS
jgi:hypothetical protein